MNAIKGLFSLEPMSPEKEHVFQVFTLVFCCALIISNVLALKVFTIGPFTMPCSIILYPVIYIINDVLSDIFGFKRMRLTIFLAFAANLVATLFFTIAVFMPAQDGATGDAFALVFAPSARILVASYASYLTGSILNSFVMARLKRRFNDNLFFRCVFSTALGEAVDAFVFLGGAFYGTMSTSILLGMIGSQWLFKVCYEMLAYPLTRKVILTLRHKFGSSVSE